MGSIAFIKVMAAEKSFMRKFLEMLLDCPVSCQPASGARRSLAFPLERGEVPLGQGVHFSFRNSFRVINSPASYCVLTLVLTYFWPAGANVGLESFRAI